VNTFRDITEGFGLTDMIEIVHLDDLAEERGRFNRILDHPGEAELPLLECTSADGEQKAFSGFQRAGMAIDMYLQYY
jgi:hypothetical protein